MKNPRPLGNALRLEIEGDPAPGVLVNLVRNPNGDLGGWGWITPVAGSRIGGTAGPPPALRYDAGAGVSYFTTENMPIPPAYYLASSVVVPPVSTTTWDAVTGTWDDQPGDAAWGGPVPPFRLRFEWVNAAGVLLSSSIQGAYSSAAIGPLQAPAGAAYVRLRIDLYADTAGTNPTAAHVFAFNQATVVAAATSGVLGTTRTNFVPNPSYEVNAAGWHAFDTVAIARTVAEHADGIAALAVTSSKITTRTNMLANPSTEVALSAGWVVAAGATATRSLAVGGFAGTASVAFTRGPTIGSIVATLPDYVAVTPDTAYAVSAYFHPGTVSHTANVAVEWFTAAGVSLGAFNGGVVSPALVGWTRSGFVFTSPATAAFAKVRIVITNAGANETHYADAFMFERADVVGTYFDGSTPAAGPTTYAWTGTAHASTSTATTRYDAPANAGVDMDGDFVVTPNLDYTVSASVKTTSPTPVDVRFAVVFWDAAGTVLTAYPFPSGASAGAAWARFSHTITAPPGAARMQVGVRFATFAYNVTNYVDAVMCEQASSLGAFIIGTVFSPTIGYVPPVPFINVLGPTHDLSVTRQSLNVGTLTATIVDASLDPSQSDAIRPGRACRLLAYSAAAALWRPVFTGTVAGAQVEYDLAEPDTTKRARIELSAVDNGKALSNQKRSNGVATVAELPAVLEGCGVPWNVNGSGSQVSASTTVATNDNASALDQIAVTRDSVLGYAWVDRSGVLQAWDRDRITTAVAGDVLDESVFHDVRIGYNTADLINEVSLHFLRLNPDDNTTDTIDYPAPPATAYRDTASIREWGPVGADFTIQGIAEETADLAEYAAAVLAANSTPVVRLNGMSLTVELAADWSAVPAASWFAFVDLYDLVEVSCDRASIASELSRVRGVRHTISGPDSLWTVDLDFVGDAVVASPTFIPSPTVGGEGKTVGELLRPVGEVTMWFGALSAIPAGWLVCDGAAIPAEYDTLRALVGTNTPNMTDVFPIGAGTKLLGTSGGAPTKPVPPHTHTTPDHTHTHNIGTSTVAHAGAADVPTTGSGQRVFSVGGVVSGTHAHGVTGGVTSSGNSTSGAAAGVAFDVLNPWRALWFIIRAR